MRDEKAPCFFVMNGHDLMTILSEAVYVARLPAQEPALDGHVANPPAPRGNVKMF